MAIITRRDLFKFLGGTAVGTLLTPVPWKLLDDVSIWTQNWSWIPVPPKGESRLRYTTCALCPAGCPVAARCIGDQPVSLLGAGSPQSPGFLCPVGLAAHHLPFHAARVTTPVRLNRTGGKLEQTPVTLEQIVSDLADALSETKAGPGGESVGILDTRPGRTASLAYGAFLSHWPGAYYLANEKPGARAFRQLAQLAGGGQSELGVDLEQARSIVGLGAGLLEGWGDPSRLLRLAAEDGRHLTQVETRQSNTACAAESWLPVKPGTEAILALGLAAVIVSEKLYEPAVAESCPDLAPESDFCKFLAGFTPAVVDRATGIPAETIVKTAREMADGRPTVVLSGGDEGAGPSGVEADLAANILNVLLGSVGCRGGFVSRQQLPPPAGLPPALHVTDLSTLPDGALRVLIIDDALPAPPVPEKLLRRKLDDRALVVCLSSIRGGYANLADYLVPAPGFLESLFEMPTSFDSPVASLALSVPLSAPPPGAIAPLDFLKRVGEASGVGAIGLSGDELIESRVAAIWESGRGSVQSYSDGSQKQTSEFASAADFSQALRQGGRWLDTPQEPKRPALIRLTESSPEEWALLVTVARTGVEDVPTKDPDYPLILMPFGSRFMAGVSSPVTDKLSRESGLYPQPSEAVVNPSDAAATHAFQGEEILVETEEGTSRLRLRLEDGVMPGTVFVPAFCFRPAEKASDIRRICTVTPAGTWRTTRARIRRFDV